MKKVKFILNNDNIQKNNIIYNLPIEIIKYIGSFMFITDRIKYASICKYYYSLIVPYIKDIHLIYVVDTTASMALYFDDIHLEISKLNNKLNNKINTQYSLIEFSDHLFDYSDIDDDQLYIENPTKLSLYNKNVNYFNKKLGKIQFDQGEDLPEAITDGLYEVNKIKTNNKTENIIILITDAYPHGYHKQGDSFKNGCPCENDWKQITNELNNKLFKLIYYDLNLKLYTPHSNNAISCLFRCDICDLIKSTVIKSYDNMYKFILNQL